MSDDATSPYHEGERRLQGVVGVRERAEQLGRKLIRDFMPDQHRTFFAAQPLLFVASLDARGGPHASVLWGEPGFVSSPDPFRLRVRARPSAYDPLAQHLVAGAPVGLLGLEFATRRRNRMNGEVIDRGPDHFTVRVRQSFGNCPKYIWTRELEPAATTESAPFPEQAELSPESGALIAQAETFFIASSSSARPWDESQGGAGVDMSHRGGAAGFVQVGREAGATVLRWLEYPGNNAFNTLGNLLIHPAAGLLFVDFERGSAIALQGEASVEPQARGVAFRVHSGWRVEHALPFVFPPERKGAPPELAKLKLGAV